MSHSLYKIIGQRIKQAREGAGMSQVDLADLLGYRSASAVSNFETGCRRISIADIKNVSEILGVPLGDLIKDGSENDDKV